jgi:hypothetical protein
MPKAIEFHKPPTAGKTAKVAGHGKNVSRFSTRAGKKMPPIQRVNVDFALPMLQELDEAARDLNISRQALIKTLLRHALDQICIARMARSTENL